jgi:hypothetical protein
MRTGELTVPPWELEAKMRTLGKSMLLSVAALMGLTVAAAATEPASIVLPEVSVTSPYYSPYTSGRGQHVSSHNFIKVMRVPKPTPITWYYNPYTSGATVCPEGGAGSGPDICMRIIHPSHPIP